MPLSTIRKKIMEWQGGRLNLEQEYRRLVESGVIEGLREQGRITSPRTSVEIELGYTGPPSRVAPTVVAQDGHTCPKCNERYFSIIATPGTPSRIMCGCNKPLPADELYRRAYNLARLEGPYRFASVAPTDARTYGLGCCQELMEKGGGWLTLYGGYGSGKTYLATACANEFMLAGHDALFLTFINFLDELRKSYNPDNKTDAGALFDRALNAKILVVDEIDKFQDTDWAIGRFEALYLSRYNNRKTQATIWISNTQPISNNVPDGATYLYALYSRIAEGMVAFMCDDDMRPAVAAARKMRGQR